MLRFEVEIGKFANTGFWMFKVEGIVPKEQQAHRVGIVWHVMC